MSKKKKQKNKPSQARTQTPAATVNPAARPCFLHLKAEDADLAQLSAASAVRYVLWHEGAADHWAAKREQYPAAQQMLLLELGQTAQQARAQYPELEKGFHAFAYAGQLAAQSEVAERWSKSKAAAAAQSCLLTDNRNKLRDFTYRCLGVSGIRHTPTGHIFYGWEDFEAVWQNGFPPNPWQELYTARWLKGIRLEEYQLEQLQNSISLPALKIRLIGLNAWNAGQYYLHEPLRAMRMAGSVQAMLADGQHPVYRLLTVATILLFLLIMPILSFDYGITWDEPEHVAYADDINSYIATFGEDTAVFDLSKHARYSLLFYGPSVDVFSSLLYQTFQSLDIYDTRHFLNALCGILGMIFTARLARELGSWRMAWLAVLFLAISPRYFGHSMNNHKDIPFLAAYAMGLFYLVRLIRQLPSPRPGTLFWLMISVAAIINVKVGGLILVGYIGLFGGVAWLVQGYALGFPQVFGRIPKYALFLLITVGGGFVIGISLWPPAYDDPIGHTLESLSTFTKFSLLYTYELYAGERMYMIDTPKTYIPVWIGITVPLFVLIGFVVGLVPWKKSTKDFGLAVHLMLLFTIFFPTIYIISKNSSLYSGWRHVMFVYAPMVVVATAGWEFLMTNWKNQVVRYVAIGMLVLLMLKPAYWMVRNHPNQYVYFNELVGGINGAYTNYETEYWGNVTKQATEWLFENEPIDRSKKFIVASNFAPLATDHYFRTDTTKLIQTLWCRENEKYKRDWDYAFFGTRTMSPEHIDNAFPPKNTIHVIKADSVPLLAIVKRPKGDPYLDAVELMSQGNYEAAIEKCEEAVRLDPLNVEYYRQLALLLVNKASATPDLSEAERQQVFDQAIATAEAAIKINPQDFPSFTALGLAYSRMGQRKRDPKLIQQSLRYFDLAVEYKINNVGGHQHKGNALVMLGRFDEAIAAFEDAAKYDQGRNPLIYLDAAKAMIGKAQGMEGSFQQQAKIDLLNQALGNLNAVLQRRPDVLEAYRLMSQAFQIAGDQERAQQYFQKYIQATQGQ